jgi:hypothetical protein
VPIGARVAVCRLGEGCIICPYGVLTANVPSEIS